MCDSQCNNVCSTGDTVGGTAQSVEELVSPDIDFLTRWQITRDLLGGSGDPFDGNIEEYRMWKSRISYEVDLSGCSPVTELSILRNNTSGLPRQMIDRFCAFVQDPANLLKRIWAWLDREYDHPIFVANSLLCRFYAVEPFSHLEPMEPDFPENLNRMQKFVQLCQLMKAEFDRCTELLVLDTQEGISFIVNRMPAKFREDFNEHFFRVLRKQELPSFKRVVKFLSNYVHGLSHPYLRYPVLKAPEEPLGASSSSCRVGEEIHRGSQEKLSSPVVPSITPLMSLKFSPNRWLPCWYKFIQHSPV